MTGASSPAARALPLKLADAIGGEREAVAWLESDKGVAKDLPVRDYRPKAGWSPFKLSSLAAAAASGLGLTSLARSLRYGDRHRAG